MSMYNMLHGVNQSAFMIFPMLGFGHPEDGKMPRFRDCFISDDKKHIEVYTRMGGGNRDCYCEDFDLKKGECNACLADKIEESDECISRIDDDFDCTYCTFTFKVPLRWKRDFKLLLKGKEKETSFEYKKMVLSLLKKKETKRLIRKILYQR